MASTLSRSESKNLYSWWWDSHISPKNSKWLKGNLTDMDIKVKSMIKIIEVDQDTFAKRAEMYYKKRPELMKLVEEFYRAYRALAERYDHATGVIREAQTTMQEAFPNQAPFLMNDDEPVHAGDDSNPRTPEMHSPIRAISDLDDLHKGAVGLSSSEHESFKESKNLNGVEKTRKALNFHEIEKSQTEVSAESERFGKAESDIQSLKDSLAKLEAEKETGLLEYEKTLDRLSKLEYDFSQAKGDSLGLNERAIKAEAQVESLKEFLAKVETEREASLTEYRQCLSKMANLESQISRFEEDAGKADNEATALTEELSRIKNEKEGLLAKYMKALEKLANLENKLMLAEDYASSTTERAERAEKDVDILRETITRLTEEKEVAVLKHEQSLEKIATLEREIVLIQEEAERLKAVVQDGVLKMKETEKENMSLQFELTEKEKEMSRLWTAVQEERLRFTDAEAGYEALQNLHSKVQDELRSVANELQRKVQLLKELESQKQELEAENKNLDDLNLASGISMKSMEEEILGLKQELNSLSQKYQDLSRQVESAGLDPESVGSSVKELRDENSKLSESHQKSNSEISSLVERLGVMERLVQKNEVLENSLSDLGAELEEARGKVKELEESYELLTGENGALTSRLRATTENLEDLAQRNTVLENSVFEVNVELEMLRLKSKNFEDSCKVLNEENSALVTEKQALASELDLTQNRLVDLGKRHVDLEERYSNLEEERKSTLLKMEVLQEHANAKQLSQNQMAVLEKQIEHLQEEGDQMRGEFEEELDNAVNAQFEIFVLRECIQDLKENNFSLLIYCEKLLEVSRLSEKITSQSEKESLIQLLDTLEAVVEPSGDCYNNEDQRFIHLIRVKLESIKNSLYGAWDENHELVDVIQQLKEDVSDLNAVIYTFKGQVGSRNENVSLQQKETQKLLESNEELILKVREGNMREAILITEVENLRKKLLNLQMDYNDLQNENSRIIGEVIELDNLSFIFKNVILEKSKNVIELTHAIAKLCSDNDILEEKVRSVERHLENARTQNTDSKNELEGVIIANDQLKDEIVTLQKKHGESEARVRVLNSQLQKGKDEVILWETVAGTFFSELQSSSVREALTKEKFAEIIRAYEVLEDESYHKGIDIDKLRERVEDLEGENSEIKARLAADLSAITSLKDSVTSLEKHAISLTKNREVGNEVIKDIGDEQAKSESQPGELISLLEVRTRIQDVEKSLIELKKQSDEEYSGVRFDLDSALHQIKALKTQSRRLSRNARSNSEEELLMKDIVLDQASDNSSSGQNRNIIVADERVIDMWETIDRSCNLIDLTGGKPKKSATPSSESLVVRELGVDEQLSSNTVRKPMLDDNKKKTLERLASDVQKLTNLQITVQDLKEKLELSESSSPKKGKAADRDNAKEQLAESEQTILKLFEYSSKLMKNIENSPTSASSSMSLSFDGLPSVDTSFGSGRWRKSMDQARKISEKIGRLQLEVQKVQFFLMKLQNNSNKTGKSGTKVAERSTRVLLRDYLYGGSRSPRTPRRRKRTATATAAFCGCVQPATKGGSD